MKKQTFNKKSYYLLFSAYFILFGILIAVTTSAVNYKMHINKAKAIVSKMALDEFENKKELLEHYIGDAEQMVAAIADSRLLGNYIKNSSEANRDIMNSFFKTEVQEHSDLMQLRYIDSSGMEKVRVDRDYSTNSLIVVQPAELQDKGDRYYFTETAEHDKGFFWHSNLDLNIEHGKIEVPIKPTYRIATPIYADGRFKGIVIINIMMKKMLLDITTSKNFDFYMADKSGNVIVSPDPAQSWGKYLPGRQKIDKILPKRPDSTPLKYKCYRFCLSDILLNNEDIKMILVPKPLLLSSLSKSNVSTTLISALIVLVVSAPLAWIMSFIPAGLQKKLLEAHSRISRYNSIIDQNIPTSKTDADGIITDVSSKFLELNGYTREHMIGRSHNILRHPDMPDEYFKEMWENLTAGKVWTGEVVNLDSSKKPYWIKQVITPEIDKDGRITGYTSIALDITDKKIIEKMSVTDRLTGLYNRHRLDEVLSAETERVKRYGTDLSAVLIDIDHFKKVNDTYGHNTGDMVLKQLAEIIRSNIRNTDCAGRWGGEKFIIIAPQTDAEHAAQLAEKLRMAVEKAEFAEAGSITISAGAAQYSSGETEAHFINRADTALYQAKQQGRNRVCTAGQTDDTTSV